LSLIVELEALQEAIIHVTLEDLQSDEAVDKVIGNPLKHTFVVLIDMLIQRSQEAIDREAERNKAKREAKTARKPTKDETSIGDDVQSTSDPPSSSTMPCTPHKRHISETSFGSRSTETTPTKMESPEKNVQYLQDTLVREVIDAVFGPPYVHVKWPRGRTKLRLAYDPFSLYLTN
jgi:hypothetical protein